MTGRRVHALELNPAYVDVAVLRWQNFTGLEAKLETTGKSFAETAAERHRSADASAGSATCATKTDPASKRKAGSSSPTSAPSTGTGPC